MVAELPHPGDVPPDDAPEWTRAFVSMMRSAIAQNSGDVDTLGVESERALALFRELGDVWGIAFASQMRSEWLMLAGPARRGARDRRCLDRRASRG